MFVFPGHPENRNLDLAVKPSQAVGV